MHGALSLWLTLPYWFSVVSGEYGNTVYRGYVWGIVPHSLLGTSKLIGPKVYTYYLHEAIWPGE